MKRPQPRIKPTTRTGNIRKDSTPEQLAGIGAVALSYNEVDEIIDALFQLSTGVPLEMGRQISSRINGIDGKIELVKQGFASLGATDQVKDLLANSLGEAGFVRLKKLRDAVIHATILDAPAGIGRTFERRGKASEILLTDTALNGLYDHLTALRMELIDALQIAGAHSILRTIIALVGARGDASSDPRALKSWQDIQEYSSQYQTRQRQRLSLPPLPEFPEEAPSPANSGPLPPSGKQFDS